MAIFIGLLIAAGLATTGAMFFTWAFGRVSEDPASFSRSQHRMAFVGAVFFTVLQALFWAAAGAQIVGV